MSYSMPSYFVYVLKSLKDGRRYVGRTAKIEYRLRDHNWGLVKSTRKRRPLVLIYKEEFGTKEESSRRELFLKSWKGRVFLKSLGK